MSEWLDLMLGEISRKTEEEQAAREEAARRNDVNDREVARDQAPG